MFAIKLSAIVLLTVTCNVVVSRPDVERNPFLTGVTPAPLDPKEPPPKSKDFNQWNVVVLPPGEQFPQQPQGGHPPAVASPGFLWLQVPISYFENKPSGVQKPADVGQVISPTTSVPPKEPLLPQSPSPIHVPVSSIVQPPVGPTVVSPQNPPSGGELNKKCLKPTGQFPSAACNKFINCWNGAAVEQACPDGLVFSSKGLYCDYPENVDCSKRPIVEIPRPPTPVPSVPAVPVVPITQVPVIQTTQVPVVQTTQVPVIQTTQVPVVLTTQGPSGLTGSELYQKCLHPRGQFPTNTCNTYVNCWDGTAIEQFCPPGLLFNPIKLHCDYAENVNCNGKPIAGSPPASVSAGDAKPWTVSTVAGQSSAPTTSGAILSTVSPPTNVTSPTVDPALKKKCLKPRGQFPSTSCNKFINCWDGIISEQDCPEGFLFSAKGYCDSSENVDCGDRKLKPRENNPTKLECPLENGTFREKNRCNAYYTCISNKVVAQYVCPEGLNYNENIGVCDYSDRVDCSNEPSALQAKDTKSECPLENGTFRNKNKCNSFYTCIANKVVATYNCPEGFNFNDNLGVCDFAHRVDCSKEPLVYQGRNNNAHLFRALSNENFLPVGDKGNTENHGCSVDFGTFRDSNNCRTYYTCFSKKIVAKYECPTGFSFNDDIGVCDYANKVDCTRPPKMYQVKQDSLPQLPADFKEKIDSCKTGTIFRLNPQCTSACFCRNGLAEIIQCPAGLAYDSKMDKCILPHLAKC